MKNDFGGTPNPLNPRMAGGDPIVNMAISRSSAKTIEPVRPVQTAQPIQPAQAAQMAQPARPAQNIVPIAPAPEQVSNMGVVTNLDGSTPEKTLDPTKQTEKTPVTIKKEPRKFRKGYLFGMLFSILIAVGCGVTAVLLTLHDEQNDPVARAIEKILSEGLPENVEISGTINFMGGEKIKIENLESAIAMIDESGALECVEEPEEWWNKNKFGLRQLYLNNSFIKSSGENITLVSRGDPVYPIVLDEERLIGFANGATEFLPDVKCDLEIENAEDWVDFERLMGAIKERGKFFAEVNDDYDFTRIYIMMEFDQEILGVHGVEIDLEIIPREE